MTVEIIKPTSATVYKGDEFTLSLQLRVARDGTDGSDPRVLAGTETLTAYFRAASSSTPVSKACAIVTAGTGMISVTLTEEESALLAEGDDLPITIVEVTAANVTTTFDLLEAVNVKARSVS
jgi:hypothetical protein